MKLSTPQRMRWTTTLAVTVVSVLLAVASSAGKGPSFPYEAFMAREAVALWLVKYDRMAWLSSDLVMQEPAEEVAKLGAEWFCYETDGTWHAVFGSYGLDAYTPAFHYVRDDVDGVVRSLEPPDQELVNGYGRALRNGLDRIPENVAVLGVRFNSYVRPTDDDRLEVWVLPAWQQDGTMIFGGDMKFVFDSTGAELLEETLDYSQFRAVRPDPEVELAIDRRENELPSVGDIFFLLSFREQFGNVTVLNECSVTTMADPEGHDSVWIHAERDTRECKKKRKANKRSNKKRN